MSFIKQIERKFISTIVRLGLRSILAIYKQASDANGLRNQVHNWCVM